MVNVTKEQVGWQKSGYASEIVLPNYSENWRRKARQFRQVWISVKAGTYACIVGWLPNRLSSNSEERSSTGLSLSRQE